MNADIRVSVIMPFLNAEPFIQEAIESVLAQTYGAWELLLVDDGSTDGSTDVALRYTEKQPRRVRYLAHEDHQNRGISASINLGVANARGEYIALLDADDAWLPRKLEHQVPMLDAHPEAGMLYSNSLYWFSWTGDPADQGRDFLPPLGVPTNTLLQPLELLTRALRGEAPLPCPCSILLRRAAVERVAGFEESFRAGFTDQAFYTKLLLAAPVFVAEGSWDKYRQHPASTCAVLRDAGEINAKRLVYLQWAARYFVSQGMAHTEAYWIIRDELLRLKNPRLFRLRQAARTVRGKLERQARRVVVSALPPFALSRLKRVSPAFAERPVGWIRFGDLRRTAPINRHWGCERGQPVDRYYIDQFLSRQAADIRGRVLEVGDDSYTRKFGGERVTQRDILHVTAGNPIATVVADLSDADHVPSDTFDCIILTQTLHLIYDVRAAMRTLHRILRPDGVLLLTVPGISQTTDENWRDSWYWSFTVPSLTRLAGEFFPEGSFQVGSHGNVLSAVAFLHGLAQQELRPGELGAHDRDFPVVVTLRAVKPVAATGLGTGAQPGEGH